MGMSETLIGSVRSISALRSFAMAPPGWAICNSSAVSPERVPATAVPSRIVTM